MQILHLVRHLDDGGGLDLGRVLYSGKVLLAACFEERDGGRVGLILVNTAVAILSCRAG